MATTIAFQFIVPSAAKAIDILEKVTNNLGYKTTIVDENGVDKPNPMTRKQFLNRDIEMYLRNNYNSQLDFEATAAKNAALAAVTQVSIVTVDI
jgi:hypothetical protein